MLLVVGLVPLYLWKRRQNNSQSSEDHREEHQVWVFLHFAPFLLLYNSLKFLCGWNWDIMSITNLILLLDVLMYWLNYGSFIFKFWCSFLMFIVWYDAQAPQRENVVRGAATRRMRNRPASGASTSSVRAATVEGWCMLLFALCFLIFLSPFLFPFAESFVKVKYLISMFSVMYLATLTIDGENRENWKDLSRYVRLKCLW